MSRGGRGGRGGGRGGLSSAARLNSGAVPFDIDEELEKEFAKQKEDTDNFFPVSFPADRRKPHPVNAPATWTPHHFTPVPHARHFLTSAFAPVDVLRARMTASTMASQFDVDDVQELNLFQEYFPHLAAPPTQEEIAEVHQYLEICARMKKGFLSEAIRKLDSKKMERARQMEQYNPFEDVPQYGKKAAATKAPRFHDFPFSKTFCAICWTLCAMR